MVHCMMILNVKDTELWEICEQKVNDDVWLTNFKESVSASEGFSYYLKNKE